MENEQLRLYDIPMGSKIKVEEGLITFHHLDGMYSYCTCDWIEDKSKAIIHFNGGMPLKKVGEYYEIEEIKNENN